MVGKGRECSEYSSIINALLNSDMIILVGDLLNELDLDLLTWKFIHSIIK